MPDLKRYGPAGISNRDLAILANTVAGDLAQLVAALTGGLAQRMAEAEPGTTLGGASGHHGETSHADPTAATAVAGLAHTDLAALHRAEIARCLNHARADIDRTLTIAAAYPPAHPAHEADLHALARLNERDADPGCQSCARITGPAGVPQWSPIDARLDGHTTTVNGVLAEPMRLCRWCYDRVGLWGRLPTITRDGRPGELERYHRGERVPWPADVARPA